MQSATFRSHGSCLTASAPVFLLVLLHFAFMDPTSALSNGDETAVRERQDGVNNVPQQGRSLLNIGKSAFVSRISDSDHSMPNLAEVQSSVVLASDEDAGDDEIAQQILLASAVPELPTGAVQVWRSFVHPLMERHCRMLMWRGMIAVLMLAYLVPFGSIGCCARTRSAEASRCKRLKHESARNDERRDPPPAAPAAAATEAAPTTALTSDAFDCTRLHHAAQEGDLHATAALLAASADANARDAWGETPLHFAARSGNSAVSMLLLKHGAEINAINDSDFTPLLKAAQAGHEATCSILLAHGGHVGKLSDEELPPVLVTLMVSQMVSGDTSK